MVGMLGVGRLLGSKIRSSTPATTAEIEILTRDASTIVTRDGSTVIARTA